MNPIRIAKHQLYLLQLENYDLKRFWRLMLRGLWRPRQPPRKKLVWTPKALLLFAVASALNLVTAWFLVGKWFLFLFIIFYLLYFIFLSAALFLLWPLDFAVKQIIVSRAKRKIFKLSKLIIIGITGSYGKTTMKEALKAVLSIKYQVLSTPESINTPVGISRLILNELSHQTEIFIVEMGAYHRGDIRRLCQVARPNIAVVTGINEAHLERFSSMENTIVAKFEIVENCLPDGLVVLNGDDQRVMENYQKHAEKRRVAIYNRSTLLQGRENPKLLGGYWEGVINAVGIIAKELGLTSSQIKTGIRNLKPIPHRLELIKNPNDISVIDDSYNANPAGVAEAIKVLAKFPAQRKIYITPGLVEMGERTEEVHRAVGQQLASVADVVILIKNSVTPFIEEGIHSVSSSGGPELGEGANRGSRLDSRLRGNDKESKPEILWFESAPQAHAALPNILRPGDVILFQNDWPDNYV